MDNGKTGDIKWSGKDDESILTQDLDRKKKVQSGSVKSSEKLTKSGVARKSIFKVEKEKTIGPTDSLVVKEELE